jgi:hypothetical protein
LNRDGTLTTDCTAGESACAGQKPCTPVFGAGNSAAGTVGCSSLEGANLTVIQDSGGTGTASPPIVTLSGTGGAGAAVLHTATSLGFVIGECTGTGPDYGADGEFCTDDDAQSSRGSILAATQVTGFASATMTRANATEETTIGPYNTTGAPLSCTALTIGTASGGNLAGAFPMLDAETIGDIVVTTNFVAQ